MPDPRTLTLSSSTKSVLLRRGLTLEYLALSWNLVGPAVVIAAALAAGERRAGKALENPVLQAEGRVTLIDAYLAAAVLLGLVLTPLPAGGGPIRSPAS